jgi:hypothetical protein
MEVLVSKSLTYPGRSCVTVTGTPYTVLGSFSTIFTCCVFSVFTFRSIRIVEVLQIRA